MTTPPPRPVSAPRNPAATEPAPSANVNSMMLSNRSAPRLDETWAQRVLSWYATIFPYSCTPVQDLTCSDIEMIVFATRTTIKAPRPPVTAGEAIVATGTRIDRIRSAARLAILRTTPPVSHAARTY